MASEISMTVEQPVKEQYSILYHGNCIDGWFSAFIAYTHYIRENKDVTMYPICPSQPNTWPGLDKLAGTHILLTDVSVAKEFRDQWMNGGVLSIQCIDHHESSLEHWTNEPNPIHTECCATLLAFRRFFPEEEPAPWIFSIDRIDRWDNPTYEDRCLREMLNIIAHKPVQKRQNEAIQMTDDFIRAMEDQEKYRAFLERGRQILLAKDEQLLGVLAQRGTFHRFNEHHLMTWNLPQSWLNANVFIMDNTHITIDSTEAAQLVFDHYPMTDVFINYRVKSFLSKDAKPVQKQVVTYSARSRGFPLTEGTIFKGHPVAAGASIVIGDTPILPFLLHPLVPVQPVQSVAPMVQ